MRRIKVSKIINGYNIIEDGIIVLDDVNNFLALFDEDIFESEIDEHYSGYALPGFINAHCHLELSHLKNKIEEKTGLVDFILKILAYRNAEREEVEQAMQNAEAEMLRNGIVAVGDISNNAISFDIKARQNLQYHTFIEVLGFVPAGAAQIMESARALKSAAKELNIKASIAPHAPYSVSQDLFGMLRDEGEKLYTLHHMECLAEMEFLRNKLGAMNRLYDFLGIDTSFFQPENEHSTQHWLPHFKVPQLMLVHNTFIDDAAYTLIDQHIERTYFCLCPNANLYIEGRLPDIPALMKKTSDICIGTDSLSSNHELNILSEIRTIKKHYPEIPFEFLLQCASIKGAEAIGFKELGVFREGGKVVFVEE